MQSITVEALIPWLRAKLISDKQMESILCDINLVQTRTNGTSLIQQAALLKAAEAIDACPVKGYDAITYRKWLQRQIKSVEAQYWTLGRT